jgi:hypothetical protein
MRRCGGQNPLLRSLLATWVTAQRSCVTAAPPVPGRKAWMPRSFISSATPSSRSPRRGGGRARKATPVTSASPAPYLRAANVDHDDRPAPGRLPDAMEPGIHCARTPWIRGFIAFQLVRRAWIVMLMVSACPESGFWGVPHGPGPLANGIELSGPSAPGRTPCPRLARPPSRASPDVPPAPRRTRDGWLADNA